MAIDIREKILNADYRFVANSGQCLGTAQKCEIYRLHLACGCDFSKAADRLL